MDWPSSIFYSIAIIFIPIHATVLTFLILFCQKYRKYEKIIFGKTCGQKSYLQNMPQQQSSQLPIPLIEIISECLSFISGSGRQEQFIQSRQHDQAYSNYRRGQ